MANLVRKILGRFHMTSTRPFWRTKGYVGGTNQSSWNLTPFLCKELYSFHWTNMAGGSRESNHQYSRECQFSHIFAEPLNVVQYCELHPVYCLLSPFRFRNTELGLLFWCVHPVVTPVPSPGDVWPLPRTTRLIITIPFSVLFYELNFYHTQPDLTVCFWVLWFHVLTKIGS